MLRLPQRLRALNNSVVVAWLSSPELAPHAALHLAPHAHESSTTLAPAPSGSLAGEIPWTPGLLLRHVAFGVSGVELSENHCSRADAAPHRSSLPRRAVREHGDSVVRPLLRPPEDGGLVFGPVVLAPDEAGAADKQPPREQPEGRAEETEDEEDPGAELAGFRDVAVVGRSLVDCAPQERDTARCEREQRSVWEGDRRHPDAAVSYGFASDCGGSSLVGWCGLFQGKIVCWFVEMGAVVGCGGWLVTSNVEVERGWGQIGVFTCSGDALARCCCYVCI